MGADAEDLNLNVSPAVHANVGDASNESCANDSVSDSSITVTKKNDAVCLHSTGEDGSVSKHEENGQVSGTGITDEFCLFTLTLSLGHFEYLLI